MKFKLLIFKILILVALYCLLNSTLIASNLRISNVELVDRHSVAFEIAWDNSWYLHDVSAPWNHDAVWVFVKFKRNNSPWVHLDLSSNDSAHYAEHTLEIKVPYDKKGAILKRFEAASGNIEPLKIILDFDTSLTDGFYDLRVFAIEMVYVDSGAFYVGDGISVNSLGDGQSKLPFYIEHNGIISSGNNTGQINSNGDYKPAADIPEKYPKGFNSFYMMKYEISQIQYRDFLNTLEYDQQKARTAVSPDASVGSFIMTSSPNRNRNGLQIEVAGIENDKPAVYACNSAEDNLFNQENDGNHRACNFLNWYDLLAYLDWAALRPMTELEYEKACRGPVLPVEAEFAWGTPFILNATDVINDGTGEEGVNNISGQDTGLALHGYDGPKGPLRTGFAGQNGIDRLSSGASFYGALELSGNLWELCVNLGAEAIPFTGLHGNGTLDAIGFSTIEDWPSYPGGGYKGGAWNSGIYEPGNFRDLAVSDRFYIFLNSSVRRPTSGGRGVRSDWSD